MNNNKMISKELCDFIESTKGNPNNLISFLRKAGHLANFSLNEVLFMKKENMRESPYKSMSKAEKTELLKKIFKNNESLEVNLSNLSEDRANEFANDALINKDLFKKLIDVCVYERLDENAQLFKDGNYFISRKEIDDFSKLPLNIKLTAIGYTKKAAYLTLADLYKAKEMQKEPAQNKKIKELSLDENQKRLSEDIDKVLNNKLEIYKSVLVLNHTPKILTEAGLEDLPILFSQNHIRSCLHEKEKGNKNWHGLKKEDLLDIPKQLENPAVIMDSFTRDDSVVIVTDRVDIDNLPIIAILKANGQGNYDIETINSNYLTSVYGRTNFKDFLNRGIEENKILYLNKEKIQSLDSSSSLQLASNLSTFEFNKILHQTISTVNSNEEEKAAFDEKDYWMVEFNETDEHIASYKGQIVTRELINEISKLDEEICEHNEILESKKMPGEELLPGEWIGYSKFYFDHIENDEVTEHLRIDVGSGNEYNKSNFEYLYEQIGTELNETEFADTKGLKKDIKISNFKIAGESMPEKLSPSERLNYNLEAISMLKRIETGKRELDLTAQEVLSKYAGWGGLSDVFDEEKKGQWDIARNFLKENLTTGEYSAARASTLSAFYTPNFISTSIYAALQKGGFTGGNILEPSYGIGSFIGNAGVVGDNSVFYGTEIDEISSKIAKYLYPFAKLENIGFEKTTYPDNFFDLAISNVPFGNFSVYDKLYDKYNFKVHDYFFAKSLDKVREGGIVAFITSKGTLDKKDSTVREYLDKRAEFIGAIRLPSDTFKDEAGTEAEADIIFLKKKEIIKESKQNFIEVIPKELPNGDTYYLNRYFEENPEMALGKFSVKTSQFGYDYVLDLESKNNLEAELGIALMKIAKKINYKKEIVNEEEIDETVPARDSDKNFAYTIFEDDVYYRENSVLIKENIGDAQKEKIKAYIDLKDKLLDIISYQMENDRDDVLNDKLKVLNESYDEYQKNFGFINTKRGGHILEKDRYYYTLCSLEEWDDKEKRVIGKADIMKKRVLNAANRQVTSSLSSDALILSMKEKGYIDIEYMKSLTGKKFSEIISELNNHIFLNVNKPIEDGEEFKPLFDAFNYDNPNYQCRFSFVTSDEYLSGNVKEKEKILTSHLEAAKKMLDDEIQIGMNEEEIMQNGGDNNKELIRVLEAEIKMLENQKEKLISAFPKDLKATEIKFTLASSWIPLKYKEEFLHYRLDSNNYSNYDQNDNRQVKILYDEMLDEYKVQGMLQSYYSSNENALDKYGTKYKGADGYKIAENILNQRQTKVNKTIIAVDSNGKEYEKTVTDEAKTKEVESKVKKLEDEFSNYLFAEPERRDVLVKKYNDEKNAIRNRVYNGDFLSLSGLNKDIQLKEHQKSAIARGLFGGNTLLAHAVGAGKTFEMIAIAMESKRLGITNKSMMIVPSNLVEQTGREFMRLYPFANILVLTDKDFGSIKKKKKMLAKIATNDYDSVIMSHDKFNNNIKLSDRLEKEYLVSELNELDDYIKNVKYDMENSRGDDYKNKKMTVKKLETLRQRLETKLQKLNDTSKINDSLLSFDELGIDKLIVDEAHNYKNLFVKTKMQNIAGLKTNEAAKSSKMKMICRYLDEITENKGIVFATGTPISNSLVEMYIMQDYLQKKQLIENGYTSFDKWASDFALTKSVLETSADGAGFTYKTRLAEFFNLPELMTMFKETADIKTKEGLNLDVPKVINETIYNELSENQEFGFFMLRKRAKDIKNGKVDASKDNMLKITNEGIWLGLDERMINPNASANPNGKVANLIKKVKEIYDIGEKTKATQVIFCDRGVPNDEKAKTGDFILYDEIKKNLIESGIPENEIAFVHDAKTDSDKKILFEKVRKGSIRIIIGSTGKLGTGTNIQDRLLAIHDFDVPWRPSDLEQRLGRGERQGNMNENLYVFKYAAKGSFDTRSFEILAQKQKYISQIMTENIPNREAKEETDELTLSYEQMATSAMANSQLKELREVKGQIELLEIAKKNFNEQKYKMQEDEKKLTAEIAEKEKAMNYFKEDLVCIEQNPKKELIVYDNVKYNDINDAHKALLKHMESKEQYVHGKDRKISLGNYRGFDFKIAKDEISGRYKFFLKNKLTYSSNFAKSKNIFSQLDDFIDNEIKNLETRTSEELLYAKRKYQDILEHKDDKFPDADELIKLKLRKEKLDEAKEEILKELELRDKILEEKFIKNGMLTERGDFMDFNKKIEFSM